jgi:SAM-dependent methyltransferase
VLRGFWRKTQAVKEVSAETQVRQAFWLVLWRAPSDSEIRESRRAVEAGQTYEDLLKRLQSSSEFRLLVRAVHDSYDTGRSRRDTETGLQGLGDDGLFVDAAFQAVLGREVDPSGRECYLNELADGRARASVLTTLLCSDEFRARFDTSADSAFIPRDVQLCELANPAKWDNPNWLGLLKSLQVLPQDRLSMHRKTYEFTQLLFGLTRLGFLRDDVRVLSVGAGHEPVLYWLANRVRQVIATDMYDGVWQSDGAQEGHRDVLEDASQFAPFDYRRDHLTFLKMDGRFLAFPDASFDVVYSLSSIEHFGGLEGARLAIEEMMRVLVPGGLLALATEYCLSDVRHHEAFQPSEVRDLLTHPALSLVEPIDDRVWQRYAYQAVDLQVNRHLTPHMVVTDHGAVFTTVFAFMRKGVRASAASVVDNQSNRREVQEGG